MKTLITIMAMLFATSNLMAQGFLNKIKQKVQDAANRTVEKVIDGKVENKKADEAQENQNPSNTERTSVSSTSNFDFIAGTKTLLEENFGQDAIGEFPLKWYTRSKAEVVTLNAAKGKWLRLYPGTFVSPVVNITENSTIEFDIIMDYPLAGGYLIPTLSFSFHDRGDKAYILSYDYRLKNNMSFNISPYRNDAFVQLNTFEETKKKFDSDKYKVSDFDKKVGKPVHVAISIQKERIRMWLDQEKVFDIPQAVPLNGNLNQLKLGMASSNYKNDQLGYYVSNFRFAEGTADNRSKLLTSGKLETSGILFATNSAQVKSDGEGVIQQVAGVLNENPEMKIKIVGHTDTDGAQDANLTLSRKRAESVRDVLVKDYKIKISRIETDGKGSSTPVTNDTSEEGKTKNRRVEFIRI